MNRLSLLAMSASLVLSSLSAVSRGFLSVIAEGSEVSISTSDVVVDLAALYPEKSLSELLPDDDNPYDGKFGVVGLAPVVDGLYRDVYLYLAVSLDYSASVQGISEVGYYYDEKHSRVYTVVPEDIQDGWAYQWGGFEFLKVRLRGEDVLGYQVYGGLTQYFGLDHVRIGGTPFYCSEEVYWQDGQDGADPVFEYYKTDYVDVTIKVGLNLEGYDDTGRHLINLDGRFDCYHEQVWGFANLGKSDHDITQLISVSGYYQYVPYEFWWRYGPNYVSSKFYYSIGCYTGTLSEDSYLDYVEGSPSVRFHYEHGFTKKDPVRAKFNALELESTTMESVKWSMLGGLVSSHYVHCYKHVYDLTDYSALADSDPTLSSFFDSHSDGFDFAFLITDANDRKVTEEVSSFNNPADFFNDIRWSVSACNDYQNIKVVTMGFIENDQEIQLKAVQDKWVSNEFTYVGPITDDYVVVSIPWASQAANWLSEMWSAIAPYLKIAGFALIGVAILAVGWKLAKWSSKQGKKR